MHTHQIKGSISCSKTKCYEIDHQQATQCHSEVQCGLVMSTDQIFRPYFSTRPHGVREKFGVRGRD